NFGRSEKRNAGMFSLIHTLSLYHTWIQLAIEYQFIPIRMAMALLFPIITPLNLGNEGGLIQRFL
ncbi:MAG TPA: hypothetical protein VFA47_11615, partial [Candidatus Manganitrophaceae bacterium]|nr:hypothetical protein [Candidatus Manganitrophaceae bacterium]